MKNNRLAAALAIRLPPKPDIRVTRTRAAFKSDAAYRSYRRMREQFNAWSRARYAAGERRVGAFYLRRARMPRWANRHAIGEFYRQAKRLRCSVDHIVPLQGENVSGLHVEYNLQIVPQLVNILKSNKF